MKRKRHSAIINLIQEHSVSTQEELIEYLRKDGFDVTQATVSRDIKELRLVKTSNAKGKYRYSLPKEKAGNTAEKLHLIFASSVLNLDFAQNIVCINCRVGMANAACSALDTMAHSDIVGTVAGDDTIFVLCRKEEDAKNLCESLKRLIDTD